MIQLYQSLFKDPGNHKWVGLWWGGFLLGGLLLTIVSIPFFSFPKELTHEKEKVKLMEKAVAKVTTNNAPTSSTAPAQPLTKNDTGYGKDIKGLFLLF